MDTSEKPCVSGVYRTSTTDTDVNGVHIQAGTTVFASVSAANLDPSVFGENPTSTSFTRPKDTSGILGLGEYGELSLDCKQPYLITKRLSQAALAMLSQILQLKNLGRSPGASGHLTRFTEEWHGTPSQKYISMKGQVQPWPDSLVVEAEKPDGTYIMVFGLDVDGGVAWNTLNAVVGIQVLVHRDLENRSTALARNDDNHMLGRTPISEPTFAVFCDHQVLVRQPILVPTPESSRIVNPEDINALHSKPAPSNYNCITGENGKAGKKCTWLMTQPSEQEASAPGKTYLFMNRPLRRGNASTGENQKVITYVPDQVLKLPVRPEASNLEYDDTVIIQ
ncbi:heme peroxidase [Salix suchowensis]|nr:heme peroxidase [Salix suchowensis]